MKKSSKRILGIAVVTLLIAVALVGAGTADTVTTEEDLRNAVSAGGTVTLGGNIELTTGSLVINNTVTLDLNGYVLSRESTVINFSVIDVKSGGCLTLKDSNSANQKHYFRKDVNGLWVWDEINGTMAVSGGCITGGYEDYGGGVDVNKGTFVMKSGTIAGNSAEKGGGGVVVRSADDSSFTMTGGCIIGNYCPNQGTKRGSGVYVVTGVDEENSNIIVGGTAKITGNVGINLYLGNKNDKQATLTLGNGNNGVSALETGASIGVTLATGSQISTNGISGDEQYFSSDTSGYHVEYQTTHLELVSGTINVDSVSLNKTSTTITAGNSETLIATVAPSTASNKNVTWSSSDQGVATVDAIGKVTAVSNGDATITCASSADNTKYATCTVTVEPAVAKIMTGSSTTYYSTLVGAMDAVADGGTITVLSNCDLSTVAVSKDIILKADSKYNVTLSGAISIIDNKQMSIGNNIEFKLNSNNITVNGSSKLVVTGDTESSITGEAGTVDAAALVCTTSVSPVIKGYYGSVADAISAANTLETDHTVTLMKNCEVSSETINSGVTLNLNNYTVTVPADKTLTVNGILSVNGGNLVTNAKGQGNTSDGMVTFSSTGSIVISNGGTIENDGTINVAIVEQLSALLPTSSVMTNSTGKVVITDTMNCSSSITVPKDVTLEIPAEKKLTVSSGNIVNNGTLNLQSTDKSNPGLDVSGGTAKNNGTIIVNNENDLRTAVALNPSEDSKTATVQLGSNVTVTGSSLIIGSGDVITLDLNGQVLQGDIDGGEEEKQSVIYVEGGTAVDHKTKLTLTDSQPGETTHYFTNAGTDASPQAGLWVYSGETAPSSGDFKTVKGGVITGGKNGSVPEDQSNQRYGGAVFLCSNTEFTMNGGTIAGNGGAELKYGGGVGYKASKVQFTMNGGSILGNQANFGGGVYNLNNELTMTGGNVQHNYAVYDGGGIRVNNTLYLGGDANKTIVIKDNETGGANSTKNVYLWYTTIQISGDGFKKDGSSIGVSSGIKPYAGKPVTVVTGGKDYKGNFTSDNTAYTVAVSGNDIVLSSDVLEPFTVTFDVQGIGEAPEAQTVEDGYCAVKPENPVAEGYVFSGWYTEAACENLYDFSTPVTSDFTLYAKWTAGDFGITSNIVDFGTATAGYTTPEPQSVTVSSSMAEPLSISIPDMVGYNVVYLVDGEVTAEKPSTVEIGKPLEIQITPQAGLAAGGYRYEIIVSGGTLETLQSKIITVSFNVVDAGSEVVVPKTPTVQTIENEEGKTVKVIVDTSEGTNNGVERSGDSILIMNTEEFIPTVVLGVTNAEVTGPETERTITLSEDSEIGIVYRQAAADYEETGYDFYTVECGMQKVNTSFASLTGEYKSDIGKTVKRAGYTPLLMVSAVNTGTTLEDINSNITMTRTTFEVPVTALKQDEYKTVVLHVKDNKVTETETEVKGIERREDYVNVTGTSYEGFSSYVLALKPLHVTQASSVTSFFGEKDGSDFTFDRAVVITKMTLPGATYATVVNTSGSGWYNCTLSTDGTAGVAYFQVPLDVIDIKGYTVNDVSLIDSVTTYLGTDGQYAKYSAPVTGSGSYSIGFVKGAATAAVEKVQEAVEQKQTATEQKQAAVEKVQDVVEQKQTTTQTAAKSPLSILGILAGLGIAGFVAVRRK